MKVVSVVGARPQFVKAAVVARAVRARHTEVLVHTGQHYDDAMSAVFFEELDIPPPSYNLEVGSGSHGAQTGAMLERLERVFEQEQPDWALVYGDTNSTLAGALAAAKMGIRVAHVEAGLRSFNRRMPEELNRVLTDQLADLLLCPSETAVWNLQQEGRRAGVMLVGDPMREALSFAVERAQERSAVLERLGVRPGEYLLATVHRAENTDGPAALAGVLQAFAELGEPVVFPVHPRTRKLIDGLRAEVPPNVLCVEPFGYLDMIRVASTARVILTDSGGLQKEAYWLGVRCVTLRMETEWVETVQCGWNRLAGTDPVAIVRAARDFASPANRPELYTEGAGLAEVIRVMDEIARGTPTTVGA